MKNKNYYLFAVVLALSFLSLSFCTDENEFYIGGHFLEVFQNSNGNTKHAASLIAYSFETELLDDDFDGIFFENEILSTFTATPSGIYASGPFNFVDYDYSNTITEYDADDDEWTSLNDGIWCNDCVKYIAGVSDTVFFAGNSADLTTLEQLPGVNVDGIVAMDADSEEFSALSDPNDVFPASPQIEGLAGSPLGFLYIFEASTATIYQYDVENGGFVAAFSNFDMTIQNGTLQVASNGDIYAFAYLLDTENITQSVYYWPYNFTVGDAPKVLPIKKIAFAEMVCSPPIMTTYENGVLVSIPDPNAQCASSFTYISEGAKHSAAMPPSTAPVTDFVAGENGEVFLSAKVSGNNLLYYWNSSLDNWAIVSLSEINIDTYTIQFMTYYHDKSSVYLYLITYDSGISEHELVRVKSEDLDVVLKKPGSLAIPGYVTGLAYDADNEALFVGGYFTAVGGGSNSDNFAYYSFKDNDWQGMSTGRLQGMANIDSTIFLIYTQKGDINDEIPFNAYSISDDNIDVRNNLPIYYVDECYLYSISTNSTHVYIGGHFVAQVNLDLAYGLLIYDVEEDEWSTLPIDESITNNEEYGIFAITEFETNGVTYVVFGGLFTFTATDNNNNQITYINIALYDLTNQNWIAISSSGMVQVQSIVYMYDATIIIGGTALPGASQASVTSYNVTTKEYATVPGLGTPVSAVLLYTETDNDNNPLWTSIYAGGASPTGVEVSNYTSPEWKPVGTVYNNMYSGTVSVLQYSTGGNGAGGINGDNSGGSSDWWWITLIVIGSLLLIVVVVVVIAGAGYLVLKRKRIEYAALN